MKKKNLQYKMVSNSVIKKSLDSGFGEKVSILLIIVICLVISYFYLTSHSKAREIYENETRAMVIELKKSFLKNTVDNLILRIETSRKTTAAYYKQSVDSRYAVLEQAKNLSSDDFRKTLFVEFGLDSGSKVSKWTVFVWDDSGKLIYVPEGYWEQDIYTSLEEIKPLMSHYRIIEHKGISCFYGYTKEHVENTVKMLIAASIKDQKFDNGSYIWVNEVINYDGGDDYAIRRIHPNLPETEGMYLSTHMTDIKGNYPYLAELEGVKKDGELFFNYYFKELNSETISEKLTYAKLYKEYDWIIAMGIQNSEIEKHIFIVNEKMKAMTFSSALQLLIALIALVLIALVVILFIEKLRFEHSKKQMELEISYDPLTNAKSRRFGINYLEKVFGEYQASKTKFPVALMLFDIDNFKRINDCYGHCEGDRVLQEIVRTVYKTIRNTDELFRLGGDEFAGIFYGVNEKNATLFADKILQAVSALKHEAGDEIISLSISIGISHFKEDDTGYTDALKRADEAMYRSKFEGGNKVTMR